MDIIMLPVENLQKISCRSRPNPFSRVHLKTFRLRPGFRGTQRIWFLWQKVFSSSFLHKIFFNDFVESSLKVFCKMSSVKKNSFKTNRKDMCWILDPLVHTLKYFSLKVFHLQNVTFVEYCTALKIRTQYYVKHWIYRTVHPDDWSLPASRKIYSY